MDEDEDKYEDVMRIGMEMRSRWTEMRLKMEAEDLNESEDEDKN